jgi:AcrR family transcriptional regulator
MGAEGIEEHIGRTLHPGAPPCRPSGPGLRSPGAAAPAWAPSARDARTARGERTRRVLVEALVDLIDGGEAQPTTQQAADRAGVSVRLVYHHFGGVHGLLLAAVALQSERHRHLLFAIPPRGPPALRIKALCRQRRLYFEEITPVYRVARARAANGAGLDDLLAADRSALRGRLAVTLAPELEASGGASTDVLDALEQATGWDAWRALRDVRGHTAPSAERAMAFTASCLIG